jgi:hypothetical protein
MAKRMNRGRSSESSARSRRSRGRQVRYCAVAALPGMRFRARPGTDAPYSCTRHETTEMMTISGGSSGDAGAPKQTAARVFPPTPIVPTMSVARWACPAPSASHARVSASPSPGPVRCPAARPATDRPAVRPLASLPQLPAPATGPWRSSARDPRIPTRSWTGCGPCPPGRASRKHHQARITGQHDQAGTAGKRQN